MRFEWDARKSEANFQARGFDFALAARVFADPWRVERADRRRDYGEPRWQTVGEVDGRLLFVAWTGRGARIRIISARRAHEKEEAAYRHGGTWA